MLKSVVIAKQIFEPESWTEAHVEDVNAYIVSEFHEWPVTAKLYHSQVSAPFDITPTDEASIDRINDLPGPFFVVVYPEAPVIPWIPTIIAAILVAVTLIMGVPSPVLANQHQPSPNNELAARTNGVRMLGRIPDIFGTVRCVPDLIMLPYHVYENDVEVEHAYMCVGRGYHKILDARDDTTPIVTISGAKIAVYAPFASPNLLGPYFPPTGVVCDSFGIMYSAGGAIGEPVRMVKRCTAVNGQQLYAPGDSGGQIIRFYTTSGMGIRPGKDTNGYYVATTFDLTEMQDQMSVGDGVNFTGIFFDGDHINWDFGGTYPWDDTPANNSIHRIGVNPPVGSVFYETADVVFGSTHGASVQNVPQDVISAPTTGYLMDPTINEVWVNVVALSGLYQIDDHGNVSVVDVDISIIIQPVDEDGNVLAGTPQTATMTINGRVDKNSIGITWKIPLTTPGRCAVTLERNSFSPTNTQVVDTVQWKDLYGVAPVYQSHFGDVTTVYCVTRATAGALAIKERKLNMLVQKYVKEHLTGNTFGNAYLTNDFASIYCYMATDPYIGNRQITEIDVVGLYTILTQSIAYFGAALMSEFCYTFDSDNMSFEEMTSILADAVFCIPYRQGAQIKFSFEIARDTSVMIFNHRNKIPGTEQRIFSFGNQNNYDSVEYTYTNPLDEARVTLYIPTKGLNPQKVDSLGVRNFQQAYMHAWRIWNKIQYANTSTTFEATEEAAITIKNDRILIADNTRSKSRDGEIVAQNVLELQLSQPHTWEPGKSYTIFLQGIDGTVDSMGITVGSSAYTVIMARAPVVTLSLLDEASVKALYWIVPNDDIRPQAFLLTNRTPASNFTEKIEAVNYDDRYYDHDDDYANDSIPSDPYD